ncbi:MAG: PKD domain-containing protein [Candidatus Limnocylindrales bacterium]
MTLLLTLGALALGIFLVLLVVIRRLHGTIIRSEQARALREAEPRLAERLAQLGSGSLPELQDGMTDEPYVPRVVQPPALGRRIIARIADADPRRRWGVDVAASLAAFVPIALAAVLAFPSVFAYVPASPSPSPTASPTASPSPSPQPTAVPTPTYTPPPTASPSPVPTPSPSPSPTPVPTARPTPGPTPVPWTINFSASKSGCFVNFAASSSVKPVSYVWVLGDGNGAVGPTAGHLYSNGLTSYSVKLTATTSRGTKSVTHPVTFSPAC